MRRGEEICVMRPSSAAPTGTTTLSPNRTSSTTRPAKVSPERLLDVSIGVSNFMRMAVPTGRVNCSALTLEVESTRSGSCHSARAFISPFLLSRVATVAVPDETLPCWAQQTELTVKSAKTRIPVFFMLPSLGRNVLNGLYNQHENHATTPF